MDSESRHVAAVKLGPPSFVSFRWIETRGKKPHQVSYHPVAVSHELVPGARPFEAAGGQRYRVASDGSLRRTDKPEGTKKERGARRRAGRI